MPLNKKPYYKHHPYWREECTTCSGCKHLWPFSYFSKNKNGRFGINPYCKRCDSETRRSYEFRAKANKYQRDKRRESSDYRLKRIAYSRKWRRSEAGIKCRKKLQKIIQAQRKMDSKLFTKRERRYSRTPHGRLSRMIATLKKRFRKLNTNLIRAYWKDHETYISAHIKWKRNQWNYLFAPVFFIPPNWSGRSSELTIRTYGESHAEHNKNLLKKLKRDSITGRFLRLHSNQNADLR